MKIWAVVQVANLALGLVAAHGRAGAGSTATPLQKVVQLLNNMFSKGVSEKRAEEVQFAAYKQFCDDTAATKQQAIATTDEAVVTLTASVAKLAADAKRLTQQITALDRDIDSWTSEIKNATQVREAEKADYMSTHEDYSESIEALKEALDTLKRGAAGSQEPAAPLLQLSRVGAPGHLSKEARHSIQTLMQVALAQTTKANAYEAQAQAQPKGIITLMEELLEKFSDERSRLEKEEASAQGAFELLVADVRTQVSEAQTSSSDKASVKSQKLQALADARGDLAEQTATQDAERSFLKDLVTTCEQKATDFLARQDLRSEEIKAIRQAIEVISGAVPGTAEGRLRSMLEAGTSFAFLRAETGQQQQQQQQQTNRRAQAAAASYLQSRAESLSSRLLSATAARLATDPFLKVRKLIQELLVRLQEEANEETSKRAWCQSETASNTQTRKEKTQAVEGLHAQVDALEASLAQLAEGLSTLNQEVVDLEKTMKNATTMRQEEESENTRAVDEARQAQTAIGQARVTLQEFYAKAGTATSLLQQPPEAPAIFDSPYQTMQGEANGVVSMLEVIASDFARLEADTAAAEVLAKKQYDNFMTESRVDVAKTQKDIDYMVGKQQDQSQALTAAKGDLEATQKELDAALSYFDKLKPSCVDSSVSAEDRVRRREEEIQSLQDALRILNGEDVTS